MNNIFADAVKNLYNKIEVGKTQNNQNDGFEKNQIKQMNKSYKCTKCNTDLMYYKTMVIVRHMGRHAKNAISKTTFPWDVIQ